MVIKKIISKCISVLLPVSIKKQLVNFRILAIRYGQFKTIRQWECVDITNAKIPWYTYPAIEYLDNIDFSNKIVFEYGSGNSSCYWAKKARSVFSVEHNKDWYEKIKKDVAINQKIYFCENENEYLDAINKIPEKFDVIIIDGIYREKCAQIVQEHLSDSGIVILDNADWYKETSSFLREKLDLLEIDFHGFGPINNYTWTTSIFFTRNARFRPLNNSQPHYSKAAVENSHYEKFN
ncbi:O-methyltransferase [Methylovulum miyakonense]|uniref:SAM-dependent methyltransferase n=1 Tax=Methylovulum miyakonense TaxID=645578 RepID=UPI00036F743A|nr:SAM-dependent methyltransferase [Methylovulum miyakonense]